MWMLISAVASASLLGSMHCVGMCGPLAIWASGAGDSSAGQTTIGRRNTRRQIAIATLLYHLGRLLTYAMVGLLAGFAGGLLDVGGEALGVQLFAARIVGTLMVVIGVHRIVSIARNGIARSQVQDYVPPKPSIITKLLVRLRPLVFRLPLPAKGFATGLLTAFLPCGWLYLFALVAAGTGSVITGPIVMIAFWLGTVPALVGLVAGTQFLAIRFHRLIPAVAALLLIIGGCYTAMGRGFAQLNSLTDIRSNSRLVNATAASPSDSARSDVNASGTDSPGNPLLGKNSSRLLTEGDIARELQILGDTPLPCCAEKPLPLPSKKDSQR